MTYRRYVAIAATVILLFSGLAAHASRRVTGWSALKALYEQDTIDTARLSYERRIRRHCKQFIKRLSEDEVPAGLLLADGITITKIYKGATKWENEHYTDGPVSPVALEQMKLAREALSDIAEAVKKCPDNDRAVAIAPNVTEALKEAVLDEAAMLDKAGQEAKAEELRRQYADVIAAPPASRADLDPDTRAFIELSHRPPGPLQRIEACYAMDQPEAGRVRLIAKLVAMRAEARDAVAEGKLTPEIAEIPERMTEYIFQTAEREAPGPDRSALVRIGISLAKDTNRLIRRDMPEEISDDTRRELRISDESIGILRRYGIRTGAIAEDGYPDPAPRPADSRNVNWREASVRLSGRDYHIITAINSFYDALAERDAEKLETLLATGPEYASPEELVSYLARRQAEGKWDLIVGYRVTHNTVYRISSGKPTRAMVAGLAVDLVIDGERTTRTGGGMFDVVIRGPRVLLGYPKDEVVEESPKKKAPGSDKGPATRPAATN